MPFQQRGRIKKKKKKTHIYIREGREKAEGRRGYQMHGRRRKGKKEEKQNVPSSCFPPLSPNPRGGLRLGTAAGAHPEEGSRCGSRAVACVRRGPGPGAGGGRWVEGPCSPRAQEPLAAGGSGPGARVGESPAGRAFGLSRSRAPGVGAPCRSGTPRHLSPRAPPSPRAEAWAHLPPRTSETTCVPGGGGVSAPS